MNRLARVLLSAGSATAMFGAFAAVAPPAGALVMGCGGLCSIDGDFANTTTERVSPCTSFGGNVCYYIHWKANVHGTSLVSGTYTATGDPEIGHNASCFFTSPVATGCSGTSGSYTQVVAPNSTTCNRMTSTLTGPAGTAASEVSPYRCITVGS